jgi:hypothetical protein
MNGSSSASVPGDGPRAPRFGERNIQAVEKDGIFSHLPAPSASGQQLLKNSSRLIGL